MANTRNGNTSNRGNNDQKTNEGFISLNLNTKIGQWSIGGTWSDGTGKKWDLGFVKTAPAGIGDALTTLGKNLAATLAGRGVEKQEWKGNDGNR